MIRLGMCAPLERAALVKEIGYDYLESAISQVVAMDEADFEAAARAVDASGLRVEAFNVLLPGTISVVGESPTDEATLRAYLAEAIRRMRRLGGEIVVFGSGRARRRPDGFPPEQALAQVKAFLRLLDDAFEGSGITVVIEPLNKGECNQINRVAQAQALVEELGLKNIRVLGDIYHMLLEEEPMQALTDAGSLLRHLHVAEPTRRAFPTPGDSVDYDALFARLKSMGYAGRMSVEGGADDFDADARVALATLRAAQA